MVFQMTIDNLTKKGTNKFEWKQQDNKIEVNLFEIPTLDDEKKTERLLNELYSRNIMFSLLLRSDSKYFALYDCVSNSSNTKKRDELVNHLKSSYSLSNPRNTKEIFIPPIKKIEQEQGMLKFVLADNSRMYFLVYLLHSVDSASQTFRKRFTTYNKNLLQAGIFEIVISYLPSFRKNKDRTPNWGIMFIARSRNKEEGVSARSQG